MDIDLDAFIKRWAESGPSERGNAQSFIKELCQLLELPQPLPKSGDPSRDSYVFEREIQIPHEGDRIRLGFADLYRQDAFLLEAKQGSEARSKKIGTARRHTAGWHIAMRDAFGQALNYARTIEKPPPFIITCDVGYCFDLYASFDGSWNYRPYPNAQENRLFIQDLRAHAPILKAIWLDPLSLDPAKVSTRVTRDVAVRIAELARVLEKDGHQPEDVATFLMRCLFTMFAEDVKLLPKQPFKEGLRQHWIPNPPSFPRDVETLWKAMNAGEPFGFLGKLLRFNGGLFEHPTALPLSKEQLELMLEAANCEWSEVEPAIFGTLLERALDPEDRHNIGAHFTPRAYVERLIGPTIEEPIRAEWDLVRTEVRQLVAKDRVSQAIGVIRSFHNRITSIHVLDPACGSGNFLYVALELFKRLEGEILSLLQDLGEKQTLLEFARVTPAQFLGIEKRRWAKEIAELVLWIGYLQWHFRTYGKETPVPEPVLQKYGNIEHRDAILDYDDEHLAKDKRGRPISVWDGRTMTLDLTTGATIPDENARVELLEYTNPRPAVWPPADFIVGNPPFLGKGTQMVAALGDGYVKALRKAYDGVVPDGVDFVMYWWQRAVDAVSPPSGAPRTKRFGLVTTNSITQTYNRRVVKNAFQRENRVHLTFAIPDHPWVEGGAAVRIAMTVGMKGDGAGQLNRVVTERATKGAPPYVAFAIQNGAINADLTVGTDLTTARVLRANSLLASMGPALGSRGFVVTPAVRDDLVKEDGDAVSPRIRLLRAGNDLTKRARERYVVDLHGLSESEVQEQFPATYQHLRDQVYPRRSHNRDKKLTANWWLFRRSNKDWRAMLKGLRRYIVTVETAKHRLFFFQDASVLCEHGTISFGLDDAYFLGILSSRVHVVWSRESGGTLEDRKRYNKILCFDRFPFPEATDDQVETIRALAEQLDEHRKRRQSLHPKLTATAMYNVLQKVRAGAALKASEQRIYSDGLIGTLRKLHDDLDDAVFAAYQLSKDASDLEIIASLVELNARRSVEEGRGDIRWLRPKFQRSASPFEQTTIPETEATPSRRPSIVPAKVQEWPKVLADRIGLVRDLITGSGNAWRLEDVARCFHNAQHQQVGEILDSLEHLGIIATFEQGEQRYWKAVRTGPASTRVEAAADTAHPGTVQP